MIEREKKRSKEERNKKVTQTGLPLCSADAISNRIDKWTPLPDRFIDEHLVEMFPLFDQV